MTLRENCDRDRVYRVKEVAELLGYSIPTVTSLFEDEPGVLVLVRPEKMHKRRYRSIRIPHAVYERVRRRLKV
jgi:AraC-like DNA-binding protein